MWTNEITRQLGIKLPFVGAGMAIVGSPELTAAVSNAGGVGLFCLGPGAPEMLADEIDSIRRLSSAPFGVDFIVEETGFGPATTEAHVEVAIAKHGHLCCAKHGYQFMDDHANVPDQFDNKQGERSERER